MDVCVWLLIIMCVDGSCWFPTQIWETLTKCRNKLLVSDMPCGEKPFILCPRHQLPLKKRLVTSHLKDKCMPGVVDWLYDSNVFDAFCDKRRWVIVDRPRGSVVWCSASIRGGDGWGGPALVQWSIWNNAPQTLKAHVCKSVFFCGRGW